VVETPALAAAAAPPPEPTSREPIVAEESPQAETETLYEPTAPASLSPMGAILEEDTRRRRFETGPILSEVFATYFANFLPFLILTLVAYSPVLLLTGLVGVSQARTDVAEAAVGCLTILGGLLCGPLAQGAVTFGVLQHLRGKEAAIGDCLRLGLSSLLPVLGVAILQGLATAGGLILCVVPGIIIAVALAVSVPAAVEERPGAMAALRRSSFLTRGYRWPVFFVLLALGLIAFGVELAAAGLSGGLADALAGRTSPGKEILSQLFGLVPTGLTATAAAVIYYRLRSAKESIDVDELASVFD
jgi:hypothetical protein